jgi:hypothetical protein
MGFGVVALGALVLVPVAYMLRCITQGGGKNRVVFADAVIAPNCRSGFLHFPSLPRCPFVFLPPPLFTSA